MQERNNYIGGSDAAAVLGLSRFSTPLQVWALKTGQIQADDISDRIEVKLGNKLEQTVAEFFMEETGKKVVRKNETLFHPKYPFLGANIDRRVVGENAVLECKTTTMFKYREWSDDLIPQEYLLQVLHYMAVGGFQKGYIACLIGNHKFVWKEIARDEDMINDLVSKEVRFWNTFVVPKVMPATVSANDSDALYKLFQPVKVGSEIALGDELDKMAEHIDSMKADKKALDSQIEQAENELKVKLGDNEIGIGNSWKATWKLQMQRRVNSELLKQEFPAVYEKCSRPIETRVLRIMEKKEAK